MIPQAIDDFTAVLSIDPQHINAAYARGACENKRGNFAKAIDDYNMALKIDKDRSMSPYSNNRRQPFRTSSNISALLGTENRNGKGLNNSFISANHTSMISHSGAQHLRVADTSPEFFGNGSQGHRN